MQNINLGNLDFHIRPQLDSQAFRQVDQQIDDWKKKVERNSPRLKVEVDDHQLRKTQEKLQTHLNEVATLKIIADVSDVDRKLIELQRKLQAGITLKVNLDTAGATGGVLGGAIGFSAATGIASAVHRNATGANIARAGNIAGAMSPFAGAAAGAVGGFAMGGPVGAVLGGIGGFAGVGGAMGAMGAAFNRKPLSPHEFSTGVQVTADVGSVQTCPQCGATNTMGASFCRVCGFDFKGGFFGRASSMAGQVAMGVGRAAGAGIRAVGNGIGTIASAGKILQEATSDATIIGFGAGKAISTVGSGIGSVVSAINNLGMPKPKSLNDIHEAITANSILGQTSDIPFASVISPAAKLVNIGMKHGGYKIGGSYTPPKGYGGYKIGGYYGGVKGYEGNKISPAFGGHEEDADIEDADDDYINWTGPKGGGRKGRQYISKTFRKGSLDLGGFADMGTAIARRVSAMAGVPRGVASAALKGVGAAGVFAGAAAIAFAADRSYVDIQNSYNELTAIQGYGNRNQLTGATRSFLNVNAEKDWSTSLSSLFGLLPRRGNNRFQRGVRWLGGQDNPYDTLDRFEQGQADEMRTGVLRQSSLGRQNATLGAIGAGGGLAGAITSQEIGYRSGKETTLQQGLTSLAALGNAQFGPLGQRIRADMHANLNAQFWANETAMQNIGGGFAASNVGVATSIAAANLQSQYKSFQAQGVATAGGIVSQIMANRDPSAAGYYQRSQLAKLGIAQLGAQNAQLQLLQMPGNPMELGSQESAMYYRERNPEMLPENIAGAIANNNDLMGDLGGMSNGRVLSPNRSLKGIDNSGQPSVANLLGQILVILRQQTGSN